MKPKLIVPVLLGVAAVGGVVVGIVYLKKTTFPQPKAGTVTANARFVTSTITADGTVTAASQARLNFQTGGRLVYLPYKEGDRVSAGKTIAQLDTYGLKRQLTSALNTYRSTRDSFDQTQQNSQTEVLKTQLTPNYLGAKETISDAIKRLVDQSQATLDNSVISVELANYALQLSRLVSPIDGVLVHQDVTVAGVNVTPTTSFVVADPDSMVFRANVPASLIDYVAIGGQVTLAIDGIQNKITGTVVKTYPAKITFANGQTGYQVDIAGAELATVAKLDQAGKAMITTNAEHVALIPAWTVIHGTYVWVNPSRPVLKQVTTGKIHGNDIEVLQGLSVDDQIIINPQTVALAAH